MRWRPVAAGVLTLIALQVFLSGKGPEAAGGLLGWIAAGMHRVMAADVAGLPTAARAAGSGSSGSGSGSAGSGSAGSGPAAGEISGPIGLPTNPTV